MSRAGVRAKRHSLRSAGVRNGRNKGQLRPSLSLWTARVFSSITVVGVDLAVVALALQVGSWVFGTQKVPSPVEVVTSLITGWSVESTFALFGLGNRGYAGALWVTASQAVVGVALGGAFGIVVIAASHGRRLLADLVEPGFVMLASVPIIALAPLLLLWFGMVNGSQIGLVALNSAVVMGIAVMNGLKRPLGSHRDYAQSLGSGKARLIGFVLLPSIFPEMIGALRAALGFSWGLAAFAELLGGRSGLGQAVAGFADLQNVSGLVAVAVLLTITGVISDMFIVTLTKILAPWAIGGFGVRGV